MSEATAALTRRIEEANRAYLSGDPQPYMALFEQSDEASFTPPFGGPPIVGWSEIAPRMRAAARLFVPEAESRLTLHASHGDADWRVLVLSEDSQVRLAAGGERMWRIRVTLVLTLAAGEWRIRHRHADRQAELAAP